MTLTEGGRPVVEAAQVIERVAAAMWRADFPTLRVRDRMGGNEEVEAILAGNEDLDRVVEFCEVSETMQARYRKWAAAAVVAMSEFAA